MNFYILTSNKKFVIFSIVSIIFILISYILTLENFSRNELSKKNTRSSILKTQGEKYEYALIGTSHTGYQWQLAKLDHKFFVYGRAYTYPMIIYAKINQLLKYSPNLKYIVIEADAHMFYDFAQNNKTSKKRFKKILKESDINNKKLEDYFVSFDPEVKGTINQKFWKYLFNDIVIKEKTKQTSKAKKQSKKVTQSKKNILIKSWTDVNPQERLRLTKARLKQFSLVGGAQFNKPAIGFYEKSILLAQKHDINVILIRHPMSKEYLSMMPSDVIYDVNRYLNKLSKKYDVPLLDYRYIFENNQSFFINQDHLKGGNIKFSKILYNDLKKLKSQND